MDLNLDESSMPDAGMMDTVMDDSMVDLFGDAADSLAASLPPIPLPGPLLLRIAELRSRGCCTKLAWSRTGSIAQISADGSKVTFRALQRDARTGGWVLSEGSRYPIEAQPGSRFVHIQFSGLGPDLAVVDDVGLVQSYLLTAVLGKMQLINNLSASNDTARTDLDAVVGLQWLASYPAEAKAQSVDPAMKVGEKWEAHSRVREAPPTRAHHPADGRQALFHVSRSAKLTLLYQQDVGWQSTSVTLDNIGASQELLSHAAIGDHDGKTIIITHDFSSRFRVYRVTINWNAAQQARAPGQIHTVVAPTLEIAHLTAVDSTHPQHTSSAVLTHLRVLPAYSDMTHAVSTTIIAVFTQASSAIDGLQPQPSYSTIARWQVESVKPTLHESFKKMKPGADLPSSLGDVTLLSRMPDMIFNKIILSLDLQSFDSMLVLSMSDGSLEYRDRPTMNSIDAYGDTSQVTSLPQTGFEHMAGDQNLHIALSPDSSGIVMIGTDGKATARSMTFRYGWQVLDDDLGGNASLIEAGAICIARQYAILSHIGASTDECLALVPSDATAAVRTTIIRMIHRILTRTLDLTMYDQARQQGALRDMSMHRSLAAQIVLGTDFKTGARTLSAQYAYVVLNLRVTIMALSASLTRRSNVPADKQPSISPEIAISLIGHTKWTTNLFAHIINGIVNFQRNIKQDGNISMAVAEFAVKHNTPVLHLMLSGFSRSMLRMLCPIIARFRDILSMVVLQRTRSSFEKSQVQEAIDLIDRLPFKPTALEVLMTEFEAMIRSVYTENDLSPERRTELELDIISECVIPSQFGPAIDTLLRIILPKMLDQTDMGKLYFWDTSCLNLANMRPPPGGMRYDAVRRTPLSAGMVLRCCRRCGSEMEDIPSEKLRTLPMWLVHTNRYCICTDFWVYA